MSLLTPLITPHLSPLSTHSFVFVEQQRKRKRHRNRHRKVQRIRRSDGVSDQVEELLANALKSNSLRSYAQERQAQCVYKLYDNCTNPNCNLRCPNYINLFSSDSSNNDRNYDHSDSNNENDDYDVEDIRKSIDNPELADEIIRRQR